MNKQTEDKILEMLLHIHEKSIGAHPLDLQKDGVQWWIKCCGGSWSLRKQIIWVLMPTLPRSFGQSMGMMRYFHEHLFRFFFFLKHTPPHRCAHLLSGATGCCEEASWASVHRVRSYLNDVVAEIQWAERLSEWNHVPHFRILSHTTWTACPLLP